jgi:hypothetical protein
MKNNGPTFLMDSTDEMTGNILSRLVFPLMYVCTNNL